MNTFNYKKTIRNGYKLFLVTCLFLIPFFAYFVTANENPYSFGIPADDGTTIQVYYEEEFIIAGKDRVVKIKIPQDKKLLEYDYFYVLIDVRDGVDRHFQVEYYEYNSSTNITGQLLLKKLFTLGGGDNEWNDQRFGHMRIDESNFYEFTQTDVKRVFVIKYKDLEIMFDHQTNPFLVKELVSRGERTAEALYYGILTLAYMVISLFLASRIRNKLAAWVGFDFTTVALVISWGTLGLLGIAIIEGMTQYDVMRQTTQIPVPTILFFISVLFSLWITTFFTIRATTLHVIKYEPRVDTTTIIKNYIFGNATKDPKKFIGVGYQKLDVVKTEYGKNYYENSKSLVQLFGAALHGATALISTGKIFTLEVNLQARDEYKKTFLEKIRHKVREKIGDLGLYLTESHQKEELLFVTDFRWKKSQSNPNFWLNKIIDNPWLTTALFLGVTLAITFALSMAGRAFDVITFFWFIIALVYIVYVIFNHTKKYRYLEVDPLPRSALELIYDSARVFESERIISTELTKLKDRNVELEMRLHVVTEMEASKKEILDVKTLFPSNYNEHFKDKEKDIQKKIDEIRYPKEIKEPESNSKKGSKTKKGGEVVS